MGYLPNKSYNVTISSACMVTSNQKGTPGISIHFEHPDAGIIEHTLWLTAKNRERVAKDLATLGVKPEQMKMPGFYENIDSYLRERRCSISTHEDEYNSKKRVRVQWINPEQAPITGDVFERAARFFGSDQAAQINDDDIPF